MAGERAQERPWAVAVMRGLDAARGLLTRRPLRGWPVVAGAYVVADPSAPVAVCTLTDTDLIGGTADLPGVAIAGRVHTANLGIEKIISNVTANPTCGSCCCAGPTRRCFTPGRHCGRSPSTGCPLIAG